MWPFKKQTPRPKVFCRECKFSKNKEDIEGIKDGVIHVGESKFLYICTKYPHEIFSKDDFMDPGTGKLIRLEYAGCIRRNKDNDCLIYEPMKKESGNVAKTTSSGS